MRLSDNKFSKLNGGMSNLLGFEQPGKCGCLKSLFIEIYVIIDAYMASHGYCPARSYTGSRWMIEMAFIKVHGGLKLATDQHFNSPHVCHVLINGGLEVIQFTLPETNSEFAPEVMDGWNTTLWKINIEPTAITHFFKGRWSFHQTSMKT